MKNTKKILLLLLFFWGVIVTNGLLSGEDNWFKDANASHILLSQGDCKDKEQLPKVNKKRKREEEGRNEFEPHSKKRKLFPDNSLPSNLFSRHPAHKKKNRKKQNEKSNSKIAPPPATYQEFQLHLLDKILEQQDRGLKTANKLIGQSYWLTLQEEKKIKDEIRSENKREIQRFKEKKSFRRHTPLFDNFKELLDKQKEMCPTPPVHNFGVKIEYSRKKIPPSNFLLELENLFDNKDNNLREALTALREAESPLENPFPDF